MSTASLAQAALGFPFKAAAFGFQQFTATSKSSALASFYRAASSAQSEFDTKSILFAAYQLGNTAQEAVIDVTFDALTGKALRPAYLTALAEILSQRSKEAFSSLSTNDARGLTYQRIRNNFAVVDLVNGIHAPLTLTPEGNYPLDLLLAQSYALGEYPALWSVEGLGSAYAQACLAQDRAHHYAKDVARNVNLRGLLTTGQGADLPDKSLLMMHAGAGIAFAKHILASLTPYSSDAAIGNQLETFLWLVRENSRPGYEGAALESLGLVTRTWHTPLVPVLSRRLRSIDPIADDFFWHGAGRAMYFSPLHFIPGFSPFLAARQESPDGRALRNALAGVAWAFTIVNIRQPRIVADLLQSNIAAQIDAIRCGIYSTLVMAGEMVPDDTWVAAFCAWKPLEDSAAYGPWNATIGPGCAARVNHFRCALKARGQLGEIFRWHDLASFASDPAQSDWRV